MTVDNLINLDGRRLSWRINYVDRGRIACKVTPILYEIGVLPNGEIGRVRAPPGKVLCTFRDPDDPSKTHQAVYQYPDHFATERVQLKLRDRIDLNRYGEVTGKPTRKYVYIL